MLRWRKTRRNYTNTNGRIVQADNNIALRNHLTGWWFAFKVCGLGLVSEAWSFEKAARASGKFGGVAGVFAGVTSWKEKWKRIEFKVINEINMKILLRTWISKYTYRVVLIMGRNRCLLEKQTQSGLEKEKRRMQINITRINSKEQISKYDVPSRFDITSKSKQ